MCYSAWTLSLVEREETLKLSLYFALACARVAPTHSEMARRIVFAVTEEVQEQDSTPRSRRVGARVPHPSIPRELQNLVGVVVEAARRAGILQEPALSRPGRPPS